MAAQGKEGRNIRMENLETINMLDEDIARAIRISQKLEAGTPIETLSQEDQNLINALQGLHNPTRYETDDEGAIVRDSVKNKLTKLGLGEAEQTV